MKSPIKKMKSPIKKIKSPIKKMKSPIKKMKSATSPKINLSDKMVLYSETMNSSKKEKILIYHKLSLETLLATIKNYEISFLTMSNKPTIKDIKYLLLKLLHQLENLKNEKNNELSFYELAIPGKKNSLQKRMFINFKNGSLKNNRKYSGKKSTLYTLSSELVFLKILNFKAENDIIYIKNIITQIDDEINYLNLCRKYLSIDEKVNICIQPKFHAFITKLLYKQIDEMKKKYNFLSSIKKTKNKEIEEKKKYLKSFALKHKINNLNTKEILNDKTRKKILKSLSLDQVTNNINKILAIYNKEKEEQNNNYSENDIIIINAKSENEDNKDTENNIEENQDKENKKDEEDKESVLSSVNSSQISSKLGKNNRKIVINNNIHPIINFNINFSLNLDKIERENENVEYNSERNKNKDNMIYLCNTKKKKGLGSTGSLPYLMLRGEKNKSNKKIKSNLYTSLIRHNSYSSEDLNKEFLVTI